MLHYGLTGTSSLFEFCPNVAAVIVEVAGIRAVVVNVVVVLFVFSRYGFTELFVHVEKFLISDSFVLYA